MKHFILIALSLFFSLISFSQKFDLIVTAKGDSIACKIDSVTNDNIHFRMILDYNWTSIVMKKDQIIDFKKSALENESIIFKAGTSYIESVKTDKPVNSIRDIRKNSIYAEAAGNGILMSFNYDRIFAVGKSSGLVTRVGYGLLFKLFVGETSFLYGRTKHFFEAGVGCSTDFHHYLINFRSGYRYQGDKGLMLRAAPLLVYNKFSGDDNPWSFWYGVAVGYSF